MGQGQPLLAAEPGKPREELTLAPWRRLPAAQWMKVRRQRCVHFRAFSAAQHHAVEPGNGQAREADGHLIAGANVQLFQRCSELTLTRLTCRSSSFTGE